MAWSERITVESHILAGKPVIRGTRLSVAARSRPARPKKSTLLNYPGTERKDTVTCLPYASYSAHEHRAYPKNSVPGQPD